MSQHVNAMMLPMREELLLSTVASLLIIIRFEACNIKIMKWHVKCHPKSCRCRAGQRREIEFISIKARMQDSSVRHESRCKCDPISRIADKSITEMKTENWKERKREKTQLRVESAFITSPNKKHGKQSERGRWGREIANNNTNSFPA